MVLLCAYFPLFGNFDDCRQKQIHVIAFEYKNEYTSTTDFDFHPRIYVR